MEAESVEVLENRLTNSAKAHLLTLGFRVEAPARLRGASGAEHLASLSAVANDGRVILLDTYVSSQKLEEVEVISTFVKALDTSASEKYILAVPGATDSARRLVQLYGIRLIEGANVEEGLAKFQMEYSGKRGDQVTSSRVLKDLDPLGPGVLTCKRCRYIWKTRSKLRYVTCPSCFSRVDSTKGQLVSRLSEH